MKPIVDRAEVSIDFPDKAYIGSFGRQSGYEVRTDADEVLLKLIRPGEDRRECAMHLHYYLLADILHDMAQALEANPPLDDAHREPLQAAAKSLVGALKRRRRGKGA